jgi:hypothetical protein
MYSMKSQASFWGSKAEQINFVNPCIIEEFSKYVEKDSLILEYGCGYGRILADLSVNGYTNLHGAEDRDSLSLIASVVYDELGNGISDKAHSYLFQKFALSVDNCINLSSEGDQVVSGVKKYLNDLWDSFDSSSLPKALAAYVFLEESAVAFYPIILNILKRCPFLSDDSLEFFHLHSILEVEHEKAANELVIRQNFSFEDQGIYNNQLEYLKRSWEVFWKDILNEAHKFLEATDVSTYKLAENLLLI